VLLIAASALVPLLSPGLSSALGHAEPLVPVRHSNADRPAVHHDTATWWAAAGAKRHCLFAFGTGLAELRAKAAARDACAAAVSAVRSHGPGSGTSLRRTPRPMDAVDFAILGGLVLAGQARFWAGGLVADPRAAPGRIAERVGMSPIRVRARLADWRRRRVLGGFEAWPNPSLFGATLTVTDFSAATPGEANEILDRLGRTEGALSGRVLIGDRGRVVRAFHAVDGRVDLERNGRDVARRIGRDPLRGPRRYWVPPPDVEPGPRDWAVVAFYRSFPEAGTAEAAARIGLGARGVARRRDSLARGHVLWWIARLNPVWTPVVALRIRASSPDLREDVKARLGRALPGWIPGADDGFGEPPVFSSDVLEGLARVDTPGAIEDAVHRALGVAGVRSVRWAIPHAFRSYGAWLDARLAEKLPPAYRGLRTSLRASSSLGPEPALSAEGEPPAGEAS
jgi:DNA-binding Lrp family transcriptional regulator